MYGLTEHQDEPKEYDFGDSWEHEIVVEKKLPESEGAPVPVRLAGARHRPPEDMGGVGGRHENLAWAQKDTRGRLFDPECPHGSKSQLSHPTSLPARNPQAARALPPPAKEE